MDRGGDQASGARWVSRWRSSGLSGAAFAAKHGLHRSTLYGWGRRFEAGAQELDTARSQRELAPRFTEVRLHGRDRADAAKLKESADAVGAAMIEVVSHSGRIVRVHRAVDAELLAAVLAVVDRC